MDHHGGPIVGCEIPLVVAASRGDQWSEVSCYSKETRLLAILYISVTLDSPFRGSPCSSRSWGSQTANPYSMTGRTRVLQHWALTRLSQDLRFLGRKALVLLAFWAVPVMCWDQCTLECKFEYPLLEDSRLLSLLTNIKHIRPNNTFFFSAIAGKLCQKFDKSRYALSAILRFITITMCWYYF